MRELMAARTRELSPDSGVEGSRYGEYTDGSDMESSYAASRHPSPSRRALSDNHQFQMRRDWPNAIRVQKRQHLDAFKELLLKRCQSLASAWRTFIDKHWQGRISLYDFTQACAEFGYSKKLKVWQELDVDKAGSVTLSELDWEGAEALGKFYAALNQVYGSCKNAAKKWNMTGPRKFHLNEF